MPFSLNHSGGYANICPVFNDCDFIDVYRNEVDSWRAHPLSDTDPAAALAVSVRSASSRGLMQPGRVAVRRPATVY